VSESDECLICVNDCPLQHDNGVRCSDSVIKRQAILYLCKSAGPLTLQEITALMISIDCDFALSLGTYFFSNSWTVRVNGAVTFHPANLMDMFPFKYLTPVNSDSDSIYYGFNTAAEDNCVYIDKCKYFLSCITSDFFMNSHTAISELKSVGIDRFTRNVLKKIPPARQAGVISIVIRSISHRGINHSRELHIHPVAGC